METSKCRSGSRQKPFSLQDKVDIGPSTIISKYIYWSKMPLLAMLEIIQIEKKL